MSDNVYILHSFETDTEVTNAPEFRVFKSILGAQIYVMELYGYDPSDSEQRKDFDWGGFAYGNSNMFLDFKHRMFHIWERPIQF